MSRSGIHPGFIILASVFVIGVFTVVFVQLPGSTLFWREVQNSGHTILFMVMTLVFMMMLRPAVMTDSLYDQYVIYIMILVAVAVLTELGQLLTQRTPSMLDIARNIAGILVGTGIYAIFDTRLFTLWGQRWRIGVLVLTTLVLVLSLTPLLSTALAYQYRNQAFPLISDFQSGWARKFTSLEQADLTQVSAANETAPAGLDRLSQLELKPGVYPGIAIVEPYPDWTAYTRLVLDLHSPEAVTFDLVIRIHDCRHSHDFYDRFNRVLTVIPGNNSYQIALSDIEHAPRSRLMNMKCISGVMLFVSGLEKHLVVHPGVMRLE